MTLKITVGPNGEKKIEHTPGTTMGIRSAGKIAFNGPFENSGEMNVDIRANLAFMDKVINSGSFDVKDYVGEGYAVVERAIAELPHGSSAKDELTQALHAMRSNDGAKANGAFSRFLGYIKTHPTLITNSVSIMLHLFHPAK